jgi:hypothetical protein
MSSVVGGGKSSLGLAVAALLASAAVVASPTKASAFDIGGLVRVAMSHYGGGYRVSGGHRVHEASRRSHHSNDDNDSDDAPSSTDTPPGNQDGNSTPRRVASDSGKPKTSLVSSGRAYAEEPSFAPAR